MDINILIPLLAQRIDPARFEISGGEVKWHGQPTLEELAIVDDVIANYGTLEAEYLAKKANEAKSATVKAALAEIDLKSIRTMREWVAKQETSPQFIKEYEAQAQTERTKLK